MRKKFIKSSRPTYKKRIKKAQQGMKFVSYNPVSNPTIDYTDITNPINPFSEYNYNTTYDKPEALVVPVRDTNETDVVANNPTVEPVINKPVASKSVTDKPVTKTANSTWKSPYTNRRQWSTELINAYKKAGITNDNAIRMLLAQDALESSWGKSAQGKYNFGNLTTGSSWKGDYVTGNDKNAKGEAIKQKFRSYNSMDEYAADKVQFLKRLYDFDENDDINKFVAKLTGSNKGKRRYAEATNYAKVLTGVYNGIPKGENGMIIKYQEPAQPIKYMGGYDKRGNIVLPVINENGMNNVTLPEVTVTPRNINLAGAVDRGKRKFLKTTGELATPVLAGAGIAGLGYGLATATIPTLISLGTSYVGTKVGESIDDKTDNNTNYKTMGGLIGGAVGGLGANMTPRLIAGDAYTTVGGMVGNRLPTEIANNHKIGFIFKPFQNNVMNNTSTTVTRQPKTSPYIEIGKAIEPKSKSRLEHINVDSPMFGDYIDKGSQQAVFNNAANPNQVLKVLIDRKFTSVPEIKEFHKQWMKRNRLPLQERITFEGYLQGDGRIYPVYSQNRISTLGNILPKEWEKVHLPKLNKEMNKLGYKNNEGVYTNGKLTVGDISPDNVGYVNGNIRFVDADVYKKGGKLPTSW